MFLDTVNPEIIIADHKAVNPMAVAPAMPYEMWKRFPHSQIFHHGTACCETAREWFFSMDYAMLGGESSLTGPRWIRTRHEWGPSAHPIYWCQAVKQKTLDCGALAALALECFKARGVQAFPAQFVQRYSRDATMHWDGLWKEDDVSTHWIHGELIYHEGCAVLLSNGSIQLWDASAAWWVNPAQTNGYGSLAALKICAVGNMQNMALQWGAHRIATGEWVAL